MDWLRQIGKVIIFEVQEKEVGQIYRQKIATTIKSVTAIDKGSISLVVQPFKVSGDEIADRLINSITIRGSEIFLTAAIEDCDSQDFDVNVTGVYIEVY